MDSKGGTNIDTIIGKIVVDQGLFTPHPACRERHITNRLPG
jgi:hypothetical protein